MRGGSLAREHNSSITVDTCWGSVSSQAASSQLVQVSLSTKGSTTTTTRRAGHVEDEVLPDAEEAVVLEVAGGTLGVLAEEQALVVAEEEANLQPALDGASGRAPDQSELWSSVKSARIEAPNGQNTFTRGPHTLNGHL